MKKAVPKLQGILGNITKTNHILFNAIKQDILAGITPMTKVLQDTQLILPDLITLCSSAQKTVKKLRKLLDENGVEVFERVDIFPVCSSFLSSINHEVADLFPERRSRLVALVICFTAIWSREVRRLLHVSVFANFARLFRSWKSHLTSGWAPSRRTIFSWQSLMFWTPRHTCTKHMTSYFWKFPWSLRSSRAYW